MLTIQILFGLFALSVPIIGLIVMLRLLWAAGQAVRASRFKLAALSVLAFACLAALSGAVAVVWFGYAVAHSEKDLWSDLGIALSTGIPFYVVCYGLWRMAKRFQSTFRVRAAQPGVAADAAHAERR